MSRIVYALNLVLFLALLFFIFRGVFLFVYLDYFSDLSFGQVAYAFLDGLRFDLSILLTFTAFPLLFITVPSTRIGPRWITFWTFVILVFGVIFTMVLLGDIVYFDYVGRHLANEILLVMNDVDFLVDMVVFQYPYLVLLILVAIYMVQHVTRRMVRGIDHSRRSVVGFVLLFVFLFIAIRGSFSSKPINVIDAFNSGNVKQANLTLNGCFTSYHFSRKSGKFEVKQYFKEKELGRILKLDERPNPDFPYEQVSHGEFGKKNVVFVLMESWGSKYIDAISGHGYGVTPHFDALAKEGRLFVNFFASGQRSIQGIQATLTSIPPFAGLPSIGRGLEVYNISKVADLAGKNGYETVFVQSSKRRSFRIDAIADALGFAHYYGMEDMPILLDYKDPEASKFGWDYESYMFLKGKLDTFEKPFLAYLFTGTTHVPYTDVPERFHRYEHDQNGENGYLNTISYSDWSLGEFMKEAKKSKWYANTVFIFTADHTVATSKEESYLDKFRVPLLIFIPGEAPAVDRRSASHLDLMPTIVDLIGYKEPFSAYGTSLFNGRSNGVMISESSSIALVKDDGFVRHSLNRVLDSNLSGEKQKEYENELLAHYQLINTLLKKNHWAR